MLTSKNFFNAPVRSHALNDGHWIYCLLFVLGFVDFLLTYNLNWSINGICFQHRSSRSQMFCKKSCSILQKLRKIHKKALSPESLFNKVAAYLEIELKKKLQYKCFLWFRNFSLKFFTEHLRATACGSKTVNNILIVNFTVTLPNTNIMFQQINVCELATKTLLTVNMSISKSKCDQNITRFYKFHKFI